MSIQVLCPFFKYSSFPTTSPLLHGYHLLQTIISLPWTNVVSVHCLAQQQRALSLKMPIKTTAWYHLTPVRMAVIKNKNKKQDNKGWEGCREKGTLVHCWWECKLVELLWKTVWRFLKKLKIELPYDPEIPHLGIYLKEIRYLHSHVYCSVFTIAKTWKQPKCTSTDKWVKKMWCVCV